MSGVKYIVEHASRKSDEYNVKIEDDTVNAHCVIADPKYGSYRKGDKTHVSEEDFERCHPRNVNTNEFWGECVKYFPLFSISGDPSNKTPEDINNSTLVMADRLQALGWFVSAMDNVIANTDELFPKVLEIGCGYGGFRNWATDRYENMIYQGLDVVKLTNYDDIHIGDGWVFPDTLLPVQFNIIYSMNVFQHLSVEQRTSYYIESFKKLTLGGIFIFGTFAMDEHNCNTDKLWGNIGEDGIPLTHFLGQYTKVPTVTDTIKELKSLGFDARAHDRVNPVNTNYVVFIAQKIKY